jgi:hypothetical protein
MSIGYVLLLVAFIFLLAFYICAIRTIKKLEMTISELESDSARHKLKIENGRKMCRTMSGCIIFNKDGADATLLN